MSESDDDGPGRREVAYRLFATEYDDADLEYSESDEERAPNYVVTPTGARVNRLFVVGVLTEVEPVSDDVLRGRVVDPTGAFVLYAGQYQPDERAALDRTGPPAFVAVTGKARTFQPEDSDRVFTSVRPEAISAVDAETRDRWTAEAARRSLHRIEAMATGIAFDASGDRLREALEDRGVQEGLAEGIELALEHYDTTPTYLAAVRDLALDAARHVAGDLEEVPAFEMDPAATGDVTAADLLEEPVTPLADEETGAKPEPTEDPSTDGSDHDGDEVPVPAASGDDSDRAATATSDPETTERVEEVAASPDADPEEVTEADPGATDGPGEFEPGEFDLDDEQRQEVEAEYGTEFQSASDVDEPGAADIEMPEPETADESGDEPADETNEVDVDDTDAAEPADLVDAVIDAMEDLDEGDGAEHADVVEAVGDRTGTESAAIEDAIQEALMDGRCYEPDDATLKPI